MSEGPEHPLRRFAEPARAGAGWARFAVGMALTLALILVFGLLARLAALALLEGIGSRDLPGLLSAAARPPWGPDTARGMVLILLPFAAVWPALWLAMRAVHGRSGATLLGPDGRMDGRGFRIGLAIALALGAAAWAPFLMRAGPGAAAVGDPGLWLLAAAAAGPLILVQATAEELLFRGYMLQQFAARSWSILGWSVAPSLLFAAMHPDPAGPLGISWFHFVFGLVMAAVTSRTANLGAAAGLHVGTNLVNLLLIAPATGASGLALLTVPAGADVRGPQLIYAAAMLLGGLTFIAVADRRILRARQTVNERLGEPPCPRDAPRKLPRTRS